MPRGSNAFDWTPRRERQVFGMLNEGLHQKEIARELGISTNTLTRFLASPRRKG